MNLETVIGLEVHAQLQTRSKMFCCCSAEYASAPPNTHVCPVCLGMPGVLPTINRRAIEFTAMTALALNCTVAASTKFDRKNYPYPDLMKGYQISQYDAPIGGPGWLDVEVDGATRRAGITRVHLEEDTARLTHREGPDAHSLVDVNRSGVPLMEIVGDPDLRSPEEARQYLMKLRSILRYLEVSTANMEEGSFRCDANISIRPEGSQELTDKVEVKNMNSFRAVYRALEYEEARQRRALENGDPIVQETRGWVEETGKTVSQRSKEYAHDYRYFPEPDLPPLAIRSDWVEELRARLPELPEARRDRLIADYSLPAYDAGLLTASKAMAGYFEDCLATNALAGQDQKQRARTIGKWLLGDFSRLLNASGSEIEDVKVTPARLGELLDLLDDATVSGPAARQVWDEMFATGEPAAAIVDRLGLRQMTDTAEIDAAIAEAIAANPQAVADFRGGKDSAVKFLVGQVMRATRGRANPQVAGELLKKRLEEE